MNKKEASLIRRIALTALCSVAPLLLLSQEQWPVAGPEARAGARWWWMGSAVSEDGLRRNMAEYARVGIGSLEITPIYGVQGNEAAERSFLSTEWMQALRCAEDEGRRQGILIDMNTGTGWPFGGPHVPLDEAACKAVLLVDTVLAGLPPQKHLPEREQPVARLIVERRYGLADGREQVLRLYQSRTRQMVKRAAPGGEGYVVDHFDSTAVAHYLQRFDLAFEQTGTPFPHNFFNDSYEVYGADWTPTMLAEFRKRRGYALEDHLRELYGLLDDGNETLADYRETLGELLLENFTGQWTRWAHRHGAQTRNQAHGSPANLIDVYAAVDVPEIEGFGLTDFGIRELRRDTSYTRRNDSDLSMLKYASSAAHVTGKWLTSSETFTWLTEHFRTSLSQMKPDLDLMFCCGVNHMFFHGTTYSPPEDAWPGWKFYASVDMSPTNSIWRDAPSLMQYIERCQSFLQMGQPDNDFLVYLPVRDMWREGGRQPKDGPRTQLLMQFDIHSMARKAPDFIRAILRIDSLGYDCDYISDRLLSTVTLEVSGQYLVTAAGTRYRGLIIPTGTTVSPELQAGLSRLQPLVVMGEDGVAMAQLARPEVMKTRHGLHIIRRRNADGYHYFIANLSPRDVDDTVPLAVSAGRAVWFNPMTGDICDADLSAEGVHISLRSGESLILKTYSATALPQATSARSPKTTTKKARKGGEEREEIALNGFTLTFQDEHPRVSKTFSLDALQGWEQLDDDSVRVTMGTGVYTTTVRLNRRQARRNWQIDLGDVRESARVYINNVYVGCAWAVPFVLDCRHLLHRGTNDIRIEVTNLPANRIADLDRKGVKWRKFKEINVVDIHYQRTSYADWQPVPSGLCSEVKLKSVE